MSNTGPDDFKSLLSKIVKTPEYFTTDDLQRALNILFTPDADPVLPAQAGAFLTALHLTKVERKPEMLAAAAAVLRERALKADVECSEEDFVVDIVGTGGDGYNTFNVSTTAAIVAAGAGARVCKHGSRASTSSSGSADLLHSLGCQFTPPEYDPNTPTHIPRIPFTFILAPHYHPSLALLSPLRKSLPFRTLFNILGPLINPAKPRGMVVGVADKELGLTFAMSLRDSGVQRAFVVCGKEGLDEISCAGDTYAWELHPSGHISQLTLHPHNFGLQLHSLTDVVGASPQQNANTFTRLLSPGENNNSIPENLRPVLDFVVMNASALLVVAGVAADFREGARLALDSVVSGRAWDALQKFKSEGLRVAASASESIQTS